MEDLLQRVRSNMIPLFFQILRRILDTYITSPDPERNNSITDLLRAN